MMLNNNIEQTCVEFLEKEAHQNEGPFKPISWVWWQCWIIQKTLENNALTKFDMDKIKGWGSVENKTIEKSKIP